MRRKCFSWQLIASLRSHTVNRFSIFYCTLSQCDAGSSEKAQWLGWVREAARSRSRKLNSITDSFSCHICSMAFIFLFKNIIKAPQILKLLNAGNIYIYTHIYNFPALSFIKFWGFGVLSLYFLNEITETLVLWRTKLLKDCFIMGKDIS